MEHASTYRLPSEPLLHGSVVFLQMESVSEFTLIITCKIKRVVVTKLLIYLQAELHVLSRSNCDVDDTNERNQNDTNERPVYCFIFVTLSLAKWKHCPSVTILDPWHICSILRLSHRLFE